MVQQQCGASVHWKDQKGLAQRAATARRKASRQQALVDETEKAVAAAPEKLEKAKAELEKLENSAARGKGHTRAIANARKKVAALENLPAKLEREKSVAPPLARLAVEDEGERDRWAQLREEFHNVDPCCQEKKAKDNVRATRRQAEIARDNLQQGAVVKRQKAYDQWLALSGPKKAHALAKVHALDEEIASKQKRIERLDQDAALAQAELENAQARSEQYRQRLREIVSKRSYPSCPLAPQVRAQPNPQPALGDPVKQCPHDVRIDGDYLRRFFAGRPAAARQQNLDELAEQINESASSAGVKDRKSMAAFISQVAVETNDFQMVREGGPSCVPDELMFEAAYGGRVDLGNLCAGDGQRFRGRGYKQLTGRANYVKFAEHSGMDVVTNPELLEQPAGGWNSAAWYWRNKNLGAHAADLPDRLDPQVVPTSNKAADLAQDAKYDPYNRITRGVNGGFNGGAERRRLYNSAMDAYHVNPPRGVPSNVPARAPLMIDPG